MKVFQWAWIPAEPIAELEDRRRPRALVTVAKTIVDVAGNLPQPASVGVSQKRRSTGSPMAASDHLGILHGVPAFLPHYLPRDEEHDGLRRAVVDAAIVGVLQVSNAWVCTDRVGLGSRYWP